MSRKQNDSWLAGQQLAVWFGPERVALALSVLVTIALVLVLGIGPFAGGTEQSPSAPSSPGPSATGVAPTVTSGLVGSLPGDPGFAPVSVPGRPASAQA